VQRFVRNRAPPTAGTVLANACALPAWRPTLMTTPEWRHRRVHFRIGDIYTPSAEEVLNELYGDALLEGEVVDLTTSGTDARRFAVVKVDEMSRLVIVPVDRIVVSHE
jgi:hypothetical protein